MMQFSCYIGIDYSGAVILLYRPDGHGEATGRRFALFFALAVAASLLRAVYGVVSRAGLNQGASGMQEAIIRGSWSRIYGVRLNSKPVTLVRYKKIGGENRFL